MFERFTDRARKVMALANQEAQRLNHEYIGTEHMLCGLLQEGSGVGARVLENLNVDLRDLRRRIHAMMKAGPDVVTLGKLPQTPRAKKVVEYAIEEARSLNHNYVGTEHMLLGLLREHDGMAAQALTAAGVGIEAAREEVVNVLAEPAEPIPTAGETEDVPPVPFTDHARKVMALALQEAQRFNHDHLGTEHVLLGLVKQGFGVGANVLKNLGLDLRRVRLEVEELVKPEADAATTGKPPMTPRVKSLINAAIAEARSLNSHYVGTEHLLLGLLGDPDFVGAHVLTNLGLQLSTVRQNVLDLSGCAEGMHTIEHSGDTRPAQQVEMLPGGTIAIGDAIEATLVEIIEGRARLFITAPPSWEVKPKNSGAHGL